MNPSILKILFHLGSVIKTIKDVEQTVNDLIQKKDASGDFLALVSDAKSLFQSGIICCPEGMTEEQVMQALDSLASVKF